MLSEEDINKITKEILENSFFKYFSKVKKETRHIILDRFFPTERKVTSITSGLQTSLGTYWEVLSKRLALENGFNVECNKTMMMPSKIPSPLSSLINEVKSEREINGGSLSGFKEALNSIPSSSASSSDVFKPITKGKGVDLIVSRGGEYYLFDIKTVQVNANNGNSFNETLINWIAFYKYKYDIDANKIHAFIAFPYNSEDETNDDSWWESFGGRVSPLTKEDVLVGNEFWSFLTGNPKALKIITKGFDEMSEDHRFIDLYKGIYSCDSPDDLKNFSDLVKLEKINRVYSIKLLNEMEYINYRSKMSWQHGSCIFQERINELLKFNDYTCPSCGACLRVF